MTPFDACVLPQLKRFDYKVSAVDLIKFVSNMKRNIIGISDLNLFDRLIDCWLLNVQWQIFHAYSGREQVHNKCNRLVVVIEAI